jgi:hypothetical protein
MQQIFTRVRMALTYTGLSDEEIKHLFESPNARI